MYKIDHQILTVDGTQYHSLHFNNTMRNTEEIKNMIVNVLSENDVMFYVLNGNKIFTTDNGMYYIQMELINQIQLV